MLKRVISKQLKHPSGLFGRYILVSVWNRRNAPLNDSAIARLRLNPHDQVLDVGFGGGYLIGKLVNLVTEGHISGIDASRVMVEQCRKRFTRQIDSGILDLQCAPVDSMPYPDGSFNKVSSVNSLFYWQDFSQGAREIHRVLAPEGLLVLTYTCKPDLDKRGFSSSDVRTFTDDEVARTLKDASFRDILVEHESDRYRKYSIVSAKK
jgi:ubiquinone/menaquinone biosynthesis C-methylase UbiE